MDLPVTIYTLLPYYFVALLYLSVIYFVGKMIRKFIFKVNESVSAYSILCNALTGWATLVTAYSCVMTHGKTVNVLFLVLLGLYLVFAKKSFKEEVFQKKIEPCRSECWKYILFVCTVAFALFLFQSDKIVDWKTGMFYELFGDFCYNIKLTQFLNLGFENRFLGYNFFKEIAHMPYHYFEMWTTAMTYKPLGLVAGVCHMVTTPVICVTLMALCFVAVWERNKKLSWFGVLCIIGCILMMDLIPILSKIHPRLTVGCTYLLGQPRAMPSILAILFCFTLYFYNRKGDAYYVLLAIPILTLVPAVAVLGTLGLLLLSKTIRERRIDWNICLPYGIFSLLFTLYVATSQGDQMGGEPFHVGLLRLYITQPVIYFLAYLHCLLIIWLLDKDKLKDVLGKLTRSIFFLFLATETFSIFLRGYNYDASQFTSGSIPYFLFALYTTLFLYVVASPARGGREKKTVALLIGNSPASLFEIRHLYVLCFIFLNIGLGFFVYSKPFPVKNSGRSAYIKEVLRALPMQKEYKIGGYIGESQRTGSNISDSQKTGNIVSGVVDAVACPEFLDTYLNGVWHYAINKGSWEVRSDWDKTPFRDYYAKMKKLSSEMSDDEIRINFIRDSGIEYVRIYKSANPSDWFLSHLTLLASDEKSGECFYKVKPLNEYHPQLKE